MSETFLKIAFIVAFGALILAVRRVAAELRRRPGGRVNQMENEVPALKILRPVLGIVFYLALLDWLVPGTRLAWARLDLPVVVRWGGAAASLASIGLISASFGALGRNYRGGVGLWDDHRLVTTGPYARVRHPIYLGFVLIMIGVGAMSASWLVGASGLLLTLSIPALRMKVEEAELSERFASEYAEYVRSTPRFLPRPRRGGGRRVS